MRRPNEADVYPYTRCVEIQQMTDTTNTLPPVSMTAEEYSITAKSLISALRDGDLDDAEAAEWIDKLARHHGAECFEAGRQQGRVNSSGLERELFLVLSDPYTSLSDGAMRTIHHVCNQLHAASTTELPKA